MLKTFCAVFSAVAITASVYCGRMPIIETGEKEYYTGSASSSCSIKTATDLFEYRKLFDVCGECASGLDAAAVRRIVVAYEAEFVSNEGTGEVSCAYYYSDKIPYHKTICGKRVNLHIAFDGKSYKIGTPLIFGWY